jgi:flavodoxin
MANTKTLVVYYSRSGTAKAVAESLATNLGADLEEIAPVRGWARGLVSYTRAALSAFLRSAWDVQPAVHDVSRYDLVIVGGPIWVGGVAPAVRGWLKANKLGPSARFAAFSTLGGFDRTAGFAEMQTIVGRVPAATMAISDGDRKSALDTAILAEFVRSLMPMRLAAGRATEHPVVAA